MYSLILTIGKFVSCIYRECPQQPADQHILIIFLLVESILFGLFTLCMLGDQLTTINSNMTQIDRLKLQQQQQAAATTASSSTTTSTSSTPTSGSPHSTSNTSTKRAPPKLPATVANTLLHEVNEVFGGSIHSKSWFDVDWVLPTPVRFAQYPQCHLIMGYQLDRCLHHDCEKRGKEEEEDEENVQGADREHDDLSPLMGNHSRHGGHIKVKQHLSVFFKCLSCCNCVVIVWLCRVLIVEDPPKAVPMAMKKKGLRIGWMKIPYMATPP